MSKAILVMDMPSSCMGCNFLHCEIEENKEYCEAREIRKQVDLTKKEKPDWCPLKPMPSKIGMEEALKMQRSGCIGDVINSYNACIDEILGDKE